MIGFGTTNESAGVISGTTALNWRIMFFSFRELHSAGMTIMTRSIPGTHSKKRLKMFLATRGTECIRHRSISRPFQVVVESSTAHIEDVLQLCRCMDTKMLEADKLCHLFKGLLHVLFLAMASIPPTTVPAFIAKCNHNEELQSWHILQVF